MEKICSTCGTKFPLENFYRSGYTSSGEIRYSCECKECRKNRENKRYYQIKDDVMSFKKSCVHCGIEKPYLIEFHHRDPNEKEFVVAHWRKRSREAYLNEISKCDPLCRNCHEEYHYLNKTKGITYKEYLEKF